MKIKHIILITLYTHNKAMHKEIDKKTEEKININTLELLKTEQINHPLIAQQLIESSQNFAKISYHKTLKTFIYSATNILNGDYKYENTLKLQTTEKSYIDLFILICSAIKKLSTKFPSSGLKEIEILSDKLTNFIQNSRMLLLNEDTQKYINMGLNYCKLIPSEISKVKEIEENLNYIKTNDLTKENLNYIEEENTLIQHFKTIQQLLNDPTFLPINNTTILSTELQQTLETTKKIMNDDFLKKMQDFIKQTEKILNMRKMAICISNVFTYIKKDSLLSDQNDPLFTKTKPIFNWNYAELKQLIIKCETLMMNSIYTSKPQIKEAHNINTHEIITHLLPYFQNITETISNTKSNDSTNINTENNTTENTEK